VECLVERFEFMLILILAALCLAVATHAYFTHREYQYMIPWIVAAIWFAKPQ